MKVIRKGVFETNSSSVHSIVITSKEDFEKWQNGELVYDIFIKKLIPPSETKYPEDTVTYEDFVDDYDLEFYIESYTTKSGDEIVVCGKYGYRG